MTTANLFNDELNSLAESSEGLHDSEPELSDWAKGAGGAQGDDMESSDEKGNSDDSQTKSEDSKIVHLVRNTKDPEVLKKIFSGEVSAFFRH